MEPWHYESAKDLDQTLRQRMEHFPREPGLFVYSLRIAMTTVVRTWLKTYHRLQIVGREHLLEGHASILVANHTSHLDALCLQACFENTRIHRVFPAAAKDYFFSSLPRSVLASCVVNALPFDRFGGGAKSLDVCRVLLQDPQNTLILFPEGTRSPDGTLGPFKSGIARLLVGTSIHVLPCYLDGCFQAFGKGAWLPKPHKISLTIGKPMNFAHLSPTPENCKSICETLRNKVQELGTPQQ